MAKKSARKEITKINLKQAALEGLSYERACETAKRAGKPSYRFTVGDKVQVGHLLNCVVDEILEDGHMYLIRSGPNSDNYSCCAWTNVRPLDDDKDTQFAKRDSVLSRMHYSDRNVYSLLNYHYLFGVDFNPDYQRGSVWDEEDREKLLDSIFAGREIGRFVFKQLPFIRANDDGNYYEIVDGKQRMLTLLAFYENRFPYKGVFYNDLSVLDKNWFIDNIIGLCTQHHDLVHKDATWQKRLAKKKTGLNKKYGALSVLNQIIPALTKELSSLFPKHFFVTNGKSTYDYRAAHGVSKDHWLDAYCIACSVLPNDTCDKTINSRVPYELKQFRRHDRRALNNENMSRVYTFNGKMVATNRHKATEQTTDSLEEFRQRQPNDVCNLKVKEHHPTYRNMNRNYPGSVFLVGNQVHVMQGIAGSKDGEATTYKDTNANSIAAGKCKFVAKNSGILFV